MKNAVLKTLAALATSTCMSCMATGPRDASVSTSGAQAGTDTEHLVGSTSSVVNNATYRIVSRLTGMALDINQGSQSNGAAAIQWYANNGANQQWTLRDAGNGAFAVVSVNSGKCLDVAGVSRDPGAQVWQWDCTGAANQQWKIVAVGNPASFQLVSVNSGMCLDLWNGSSQPGATVAQYGCWGGANQLWDFQKISGADVGATWDPPATAGYISRAGVNTNAFGAGASLDLASLSVAQGNTGNCGAIAGIISVAATQPDVVYRGISYLGKNRDNTDTYEVQLFVNNAWQGVVVDADVPGNQAQAKDGDNEIWGQLYEKALASAKGSYAVLNGINTTDVITMMTGQRTDQIVGGGEQAIAALKKGGAVTAVGIATGWHDPETGDDLQGNWHQGAVYLFDQHYYGIGGFTDSNQDHVWMINPWNQGPGDHGQMSVSVVAYKRLWWGYAVQQR